MSSSDDVELDMGLQMSEGIVRAELVGEGKIGWLGEWEPLRHPDHGCLGVRGERPGLLRVRL